MHQLREQLEAHLPPVFAGTYIDSLTGKAIRWKSVRNRRSKKLPEERRVPEECFLHQGSRKVLIVRDPFLDWWFRQLS